MRRSVIVDTSCLIIFDKINEFEILKEVYDEIITTPEVLGEFGKPLPGWIIIEPVKDKKYQRFMDAQLDLGESSVIALAVEKGDVTLILDDLRARKLSRRLGLKYTGSLGVINKAKEIGVIDKIRPLIDKLIKTDFRISDKVIDDLLKRNNE